jgi:hypothetical protein
MFMLNTHLEHLSVMRWPAFRFRVVPSIPWTNLFNDHLAFATTFEEEQYLGTKGGSSPVFVGNSIGF